MAYFLDLFTPETWENFQKHGANISGFRARQKNIAQERIKPGDIFLCYLVRLSRWCGALEITSKMFQDNTPIFSDPDPFIIRFKVKPIFLLDPLISIPIFEKKIWNTLEFTKDIKMGSSGWAKHFRGSLREIGAEDGKFLLSLMEKQNQEEKVFDFTERDKRQLTRKAKIQVPGKKVVVDIPDEIDEDKVEETPEAKEEVRTSYLIQANVCQLGAIWGFQIWVPRNDKRNILKILPEKFHGPFIEELPLNYDTATLKTIENIDVIWLNRRSIVRAFEIEHTTAVYSGLLRMADLLALQPNMNIQLHIVAPDEKREKVLREIQRPVFSLLEGGALYEKCTYLSYDSIHEIMKMKHLKHVNDSIINDFEELAEE